MVSAHLVLAASVAVGSLDESEFITKCKIPIDLAFLQDTTGSFANDLPNVLAQLPGIVAGLKKIAPGSRMAISEFRDKPYELLGDPESYCHRRRTGFTTSTSKIVKAYDELWASGGADLPEGMFHALIQMANDEDQYAWCRVIGNNETYAPGTCGARVIIMSTDARPHDPEDYTLYNGADPDFPTPTITPIPPFFMPPFPSDGLAELTTGDWDQLCLTNDYPSQQQLVESLTKQQIKLMVLVPPNDVRVVNKWASVLADLGMPSNYLQTMKNDSSNITQALSELLHALLDQECPTTTTTTTKKTTTPRTTTPTTTTTTTTTGTTTTPIATTSDTTTPVKTTSAATTTTELTTRTHPIPTTTGEIPDCSPTTPKPECVWPTTSKECKWPTKQ